MNREKLIQHLEQRYSSKRDMISRIPLGLQPDAIWEELQNRRRAKSIVLPLTSCRGTPYWYVTTPKMIAASEKIVETLYENEADFDPYTSTLPVTTLEEVFYTSYVEGAQITMQAAMDFLTSDLPPRDIEEQLITNNRLAGNYAGSNLYRAIDAPLMKELIYILTDGMDNGGQDYRFDDLADFSSDGGELFPFPSPDNIPSRADEITEYLSNPKVHPLIKAAIAQAWTILVRPFPEGNERLGRILSNMILIRSGYTFFSEISLSALIARKSYGYFAAIENILLQENDGDLTYFIEYFLELLSRAIDERAFRKRQREDENRQSEAALAHTALSPDQSDFLTGITQHVEKGLPIPPPHIPDPPANSGNLVSKTVQNQPLPVKIATDSESSTMERLRKYAVKPKTIQGQFSSFIMSMINENKYRFTISEAAEALQLSSHQLGRCIWQLKNDGLLFLEGKNNGQTYYKIAVNEDSEQEQAERNLLAASGQGYDSSVIGLIRDLLNPDNTLQERRLGKMLALLLPKGYISIEDYAIRDDEPKWSRDMILASQLGLVEKNSFEQYIILKQIKSDSPTLNKKQKEIITDLYECFGDGFFSTEMVIATLDYTNSSATSYLHRFTLLRILGCEKDDVNKYHFLVNPEEHPQLFTDAA